MYFYIGFLFAADCGGRFSESRLASSVLADLIKVFAESSELRAVDWRV